jgi:hypothetical protein
MAVVGHDAETSRLVPAGVASSVQVRPPDAVDMMKEPAPVLPLSPTATQSSRVEHEIPVTSTAWEGGSSEAHEAPSSLVCITYEI